MDNLDKRSPLSKVIENKKVVVGVMIFAIIYDIFYSIGLAYVLGENPVSFTMSMIGRATIPGRFPTLFVFFGIVTNIAFMLNINYAYHKDDYIKTKLGKIGFICAWIGVFFLTMCTLIPSIEFEEVHDVLTGFQVAGHWSGAILFALFFAISICLYIFSHRKKYKGFLVLFIVLIIVLVTLAILVIAIPKNGVFEILPLILVMALMIFINLDKFPKIEQEEETHKVE
ncbi:MAG: hypothetical protein GX906_01110 [Clostridiales bacterium]|nr:hypothetical protein [Clostridiales bacterium]